MDSKNNKPGLKLCTICKESPVHRISWCKGCWQKKTRAYYQENRDAYIMRVNEWKKKNPERDKQNQRRRSRELKVEVLAAYSDGDVACRCCGETTVEFLTIDHVQKDGAKYDKRVRADLYGWLRRQGYPDRNSYQVLCWNCNRASFYMTCPHQLTKPNQTDDGFKE